MKKTLKVVLALVLVAALLAAAAWIFRDKIPFLNDKTKPSNAEKTVDITPRPTIVPEPDNAPYALVDNGDDSYVIADMSDGTCELILCLSSADVIHVPDTLNELKVIGICPQAFSGLACKEIYLPDSVEYIDGAFDYCQKLQEVHFGSGLKRVSNNLFSACQELRRCIFPESLESIDGTPFFVCYKLGEVYIPATTTRLPRVLAALDFTPNIVIVTPAGSEAEKTALDNGLTVYHPGDDYEIPEPIDTAVVTPAANTDNGSDEALNVDETNIEPDDVTIKTPTDIAG